MTSTPTPAAAEQPDQSRPSAVGGPGLLAVDGHELELPRTPATDGADGLGVSKLLGSTGVVTLDQVRAVMHDLDGGPGGNPDAHDDAKGLTGSNLITLSAVVTDGDGDTNTASADIT